MLLMHSFSNPDMKNWLPLIMNSEKPMTDKLLMMSFMRQQESTGLSANQEMLPLLLMNDGRGCKVDIGGVQKVLHCNMCLGFNHLFRLAHAKNPNQIPS